MDKIKQVAYDEFRGGKRIIFFIVKKGFSKRLSKESVLWRKIQGPGISIPAWAELATGEEFLEKNIVTKAEWEVVGISGPEFRTFLDEEFSPAERESLFVDLI